MEKGKVARVTAKGVGMIIADKAIFAFEAAKAPTIKVGDAVTFTARGRKTPHAVNVRLDPNPTVAAPAPSTKATAAKATAVKTAPKSA